MNGLTRGGQAYVAIVALLGGITILQSTYTLYLDPLGWNWVVLAVLTLISGSATVKLPSVPATISISETFVFTSALLFGPAAGTLTVALDALVISLWLARRGHPTYRIVFNVFALPAAMWVAAHVYYIVGDVPPLHSSSHAINISRLVIPLFLFTVIYFSLNSWLIAIAVGLEKRLSPVRLWRDNFAWLSLNYFGGASVAALLVTYTRDIDYTYLAFVLPLLLVLYLTFSVAMGRVEDTNRHLTELNKLYMSTIETLAMAIDAKDQITHGHIRRVQRYAIGLAQKIGVSDPDQIRAIEAASLLHDMGKLAVPEYILNKPGRLTPAEFEKMKLHASIGADILSAIDFPYPVVPIVRHHHENWNGTGYPDGVKGTDIPIGARILSVVDCFDALTSDRPYRPRLTDQEAIDILLERRGSMYDPAIVDTFVRVFSELAPHAEPRAVLEASSSSGPSPASAEEHPATDSSLKDISASTEEMLMLYDLAQSLTPVSDFRVAADVIATHLRRIVPASTIVFFLYDTESDQLVATHAIGDGAPHFADLKIARGQRLSGWVAANRQSIRNSDPVLDLGDIARALRPALRSCLSTALTEDGQLVGVITAYSTHAEAFTEDHRRVLEVVADQVAPVLRRCSVPKDGSGQPQVYLGGLITQTLQRESTPSTQPSEVPKTSLSILYLELRSSAGSGRRTSRVEPSDLVNVLGDVVRKSMRDVDLLLQYGARELVVLLLKTDGEAAMGIARRVAAGIASARSSQQVSHELQVTLGVATSPTDGPTLVQLISAAQSRGRSYTEFTASPPSIH